VIAVAMPPIAGLVLVAVFLAAEAAGVSPLSHVEATVSEAAASGSAGVLDSSAYTVDAIDAAILGRRPEVIPILQEHGAAVVDIGRSVGLAHAVDLPEVLPLLGANAKHVDRDPSVDVSDAVRACFEEVK
jgi:hypothetical protein